MILRESISQDQNSIWGQTRRIMSCPVCVLSHVWLFVTPWTVALLCPWNFLGKNTGVVCHFLLQGSSRPRDGTWVSCIAGRFLPPASPGKPMQDYNSVIMPSLCHKKEWAGINSVTLTLRNNVWFLLTAMLLGSPVDGGAWWASIYGVAQSRTWLKWLSMHTCYALGIQLGHWRLD